MNKRLGHVNKAKEQNTLFQMLIYNLDQKRQKDEKNVKLYLEYQLKQEYNNYKKNK